MRGVTPKGGSMPPPPTYKQLDLGSNPTEGNNDKKKQPALVPPTKSLVRMNSRLKNYKNICTKISHFIIHYVILWALGVNFKKVGRAV